MLFTYIFIILFIGITIYCLSTVETNNTSINFNEDSMGIYSSGKFSDENFPPMYLIPYRMSVLELKEGNKYLRVDGQKLSIGTTILYHSKDNHMKIKLVITGELRPNYYFFTIGN